MVEFVSGTSNVFEKETFTEHFLKSFSSFKHDATTVKDIDLYQDKPKMSISIKNGETTVGFETATLKLGNFKVRNII